MKKITSKNQLLKKEIEVKDKLIGALLHEISIHEIQLPDYILKIIDGLYHNRIHVAYDSKKAVIQ